MYFISCKYIANAQHVLKLFCLIYLDIRDLSKWSERMRKPMEDLYGKEYFESLWNQWIDAYSLYLHKYDGDIVRDQVRDIDHPTLIIHGQVSNTFRIHNSRPSVLQK